MTLVVAYSDCATRTCFIGADEREGNTGHRADKVSLVAGRFAVGLCGVDAVQTALQVLEAFWGGWRTR